MEELFLERNPLKVRNVDKPSDVIKGVEDRKEIILKRNSTNVKKKKNVVKPSNITAPYKHTKGFTQKRNTMNVKNVVKLSVLPVLFENMKERTHWREIL